MDLRLPTSVSKEMRLAFQRALRHGMMSGNQYRFVAERLLTRETASLLVFGLGHDAPLWFQCSQDGAAFVEDDVDYLTAAPAEAQVFLYPFRSQVGQWVKVPRPPRLIDRPWDFVLVDGPRGFHRRCPGRQIPIMWAKKLATRQIFVHDYERPWERAVCDRVLGDPTRIIEPEGNRRGSLAIFDVE